MSGALTGAFLLGLLSAPEQAKDAPAQQVKMPPPTSNPFRLGKTSWRDINFVPRRWKLMDKITGDLDGDGLTDSVLIVQQNDPAKLMENPKRLGMDFYDANPRVVMVLLQKNMGEYHLASVGEQIIPDHESPTVSDPFESAEIRGGSLHLNLTFFANAGSWTTFSRRFQFRWDGKAMALIGFETSHVHRASGEMRLASVNYLSGRRKDFKGNISDDQENWKWSDVPKGTAHTLGSIGNGFEFEG